MPSSPAPTARGVRWLVSEFDYRDGDAEERFDIYGTAEILSEHRQHIQTGTPREAIGNLGGLHRQLLQESDFHASRNVLLRKMTVEEQTEEEGDWGSDWFEMDLSEVVKRIGDNPRAQDWLKDHADIYNSLSQDDALRVASFGLDTIDETRSILDLNSPDTAIGYSPPRDRYKVVEWFHKNEFKEASERRVRHLRVSLETVSSLRTADEIILYLQRVSDDYQADKRLTASWSPEQKENDRQLYLSVLRRKGKDFETIRRLNWSCFEREATEKVVSTEIVSRPLYPGWEKDFGKGDLRPSEVSVAVPLEIRKTSASIWDQERSKALCSLTLTSSQWKHLYASVWARLAKSLLAMAKRANSDADKMKVRLLLGRYQSRIDRSVVREISSSLAKKKK